MTDGRGRAYGVVGPKSDAIDVAIEFDETGDLRVIIIDEVGDQADGEAASFTLGVLPKA